MEQQSYYSRPSGQLPHRAMTPPASFQSSSQFQSSDSFARPGQSLAGYEAILQESRRNRKRISQNLKGFQFLDKGFKQEAGSKDYQALFQRAATPPNFSSFDKDRRTGPSSLGNAPGLGADFQSRFGRPGQDFYSGFQSNLGGEIQQKSFGGLYGKEPALDDFGADLYRPRVRDEFGAVSPKLGRVGSVGSLGNVGKFRSNQVYCGKPQFMQRGQPMMRGEAYPWGDAYNGKIGGQFGSNFPSYPQPSPRSQSPYREESWSPNAGRERGMASSFQIPEYNAQFKSGLPMHMPKNGGFPRGGMNRMGGRIPQPSQPQRIRQFPDKAGYRPVSRISGGDLADVGGRYRSPGVGATGPMLGLGPTSQRYLSPGGPGGYVPGGFGQGGMGPRGKGGFGQGSFGPGLGQAGYGQGGFVPSLGQAGYGQGGFGHGLGQAGYGQGGYGHGGLGLGGFSLGQASEGQTNFVQGGLGQGGFGQLGFGQGSLGHGGYGQGGFGQGGYGLNLRI